MSLVEVEHLRVSFGSTTAVDGVSLVLEPGARFGIIGESGSGKTLTALAIAGLLPGGASQSGSIRFDGKPLPADERAMAQLRGRRIGMVFQEPMTALNPLMTCGAQITEGMTINRRPGDHRALTEQLLLEVGLEPGHGARYPHELSGGQRQRVMIAIALAAEPDLLIADEPTSALDLITQRRILDLLRAVCDRRGMALLFISHDLKAVAALCTEVAVLRHGKLVEAGRVAEVYARPREPYTKALLVSLRPQPPGTTPAPSGAPLLTVDALTRSFRRRGPLWFRAGEPLVAVNAVSFALEASESLAIVGPSGCGKTTLARMLVGLDRATSGTITFAGRQYHGSDLPAALRRDISLVFQDPFGSFDPHLPVGESVAEPLRLESGLTAAERSNRLAEAVRAVGLSPELLTRYPHEFSGGQRQRLAIARALITRPRLVVLDEPVSALDVSLRAGVLELLNRLRAELGLSYIVISHDLDMVRSVADRVLVMNHGRIVETGTPATLFTAPQHPLTRELLAARLPDPVFAPSA